MITPPAPSVTIVGSPWSFMAVQIGTLTAASCGHAACDACGVSGNSASTPNSTIQDARRQPKGVPGAQLLIRVSAATGPLEPLWSTTFRPRISVHHREAARDPAPFHLQLDEIDSVG